MSLSVRLTAAGTAQLRKHSSLKVTISVVATGSNGRQQTVTRAVTLRLKNHR
jgi:hypothetical protein